MTAERDGTPQSTRRWILPLLVALAVGTAAFQPTVAPRAAASVPPWTNSYYMVRAGATDASRLGCVNASRTGRMTLFFGAPVPVAGHYGATLWAAPDRTTSGITQTVQNFVRGYAYCRTNRSLRILVGVGTSNSAIDGKTATWLGGHGHAWGSMVVALNAWANHWYPGFALVLGAWDFEPSWSTFPKADAWLNAYSATSGRPLMFINASADGCPTTAAVNGPCNNGWSQSRVWHLAWQHRTSIPMPQIYATSGVNAHQWQLISLWASTSGYGRMIFAGTMSQSGACAQAGAGACRGTNNTPQTADNFLRWWLNTDQRTFQTGANAMTDVRWFS